MFMFYRYFNEVKTFAKTRTVMTPPPPPPPLNYSSNSGDPQKTKPRPPMISPSSPPTQPRSQGFSLFVIGKSGKGPGTGRSHDFQHPDIVGVINYNNNELENPRWPPT